MYLENTPQEVSATITIGGFQDIFTAKSQISNLKGVTEEQMAEFKSSRLENAVSQ